MSTSISRHPNHVLQKNFEYLNIYSKDLLRKHYKYCIIIFNANSTVRSWLAGKKKKKAPEHVLLLFMHNSIMRIPYLFFFRGKATTNLPSSFLMKSSILTLLFLFASLFVSDQKENIVCE